jgi:DNA-binding XRE family transcriptional regulator
MCVLQAPLHKLVIRYHRGHFLDKVYAFSRRINPLDYDPTNPRNPATLAEYIRKYRKDKWLSGQELANRLGVAKFTVVKQEGGRMPSYQKQIRALREGIPGTRRWLEGGNQ